MAKWITVDQNFEQVSFMEDTTFPFGVYRDEYARMDSQTLPLHRHKYLEYGLVLSGEVNMRIDSEYISLRAGDCVFINANTLHSGVQTSVSENAVISTVCFTPEILTRENDSTVYTRHFQPILGRTVFGFKIDCSTPSGAAIREILRSLTALGKEEFGYELSVIMHVSNLWLQTLKYINEFPPEFPTQAETYSHREDVVRNLLIYIQEYYDQNITVDMLASSAHISHSECYRIFKAYTGKTPIGFLTDYRLSQAEHLLRTTSLSIVSICQACGFSGQSYFGELFKKKYGISPARFRKESLIEGQKG